MTFWILLLASMLAGATRPESVSPSGNGGAYLFIEEDPDDEPAPPPAPVLPRRFSVNDSTGTFRMGPRSCVATVWGLHSIITASHCLNPSGGRIVAEFKGRDGQPVLVTNCRRVLRKNTALDYAIIDCPGVGSRVPMVQIAERRPTRGESLTLVTHDFHLGGKQRIERGFYPQSFHFPQAGPDGRSRWVENFVMARARSYPGNSGSLVYDSGGNALGLLWGGPVDSAYTAFLTPISAIMQDLRANSPGLALADENPSRSPASTLGSSDDPRAMYAAIGGKWTFMVWAAPLPPFE